MHHWVKTKTIPNTGYGYFGCFLRDNKPDIFEWIVKTCFLSNDPICLPTGDPEPSWANFEGSLAEFEAEELWEAVRDYVDDENPHRSGGASWEADKLIDSITDDMRKALNDFIREENSIEGAVKYPQNIDCAKLDIQQDALYLSFNYTDTLERYYGVSQSHICYLHGKAGADNNLMIGHGVNPHGFEEESQPVSEYEMLDQLSGKEPYEDPKVDHYSLSCDLVKESINEYWSKSFKDTKDNISKHEKFFQQCEEVHQITVMGHSLSEVDLPYFKEIKQRAAVNASWNVSYYGASNMDSLKKTLLKLGIPDDQIKLFQLN